MGWPSFNHLTGWLCGLEALHSSTSVPVSRSLLFSSFLKNLISAVTNTQNLKLALQYSTNFLNQWDNSQNFLDVKWNSFTHDKIKATGSPLKAKLCQTGLTFHKEVGLGGLVQHFTSVLSVILHVAVLHNQSAFEVVLDDFILSTSRQFLINRKKKKA